MKISIKQLTVFGSLIGLSVGSIWTTNHYTIRKVQEAARDTVEIHHETEFSPVFYVKQGDDVQAVQPDSVSGDSVLVDDGWMKLVWPWYESPQED
jgi:hypothetical protein